MISRPRSSEIGQKRRYSASESGLRYTARAELIMWTRGIAGVVLCFIGAVWIAQGTDVVHGSGMSGHGQWAVIGGVVALIGLVLLAWACRIRSGRPRRTA